MPKWALSTTFWCAGRVTREHAQRPTESVKSQLVSVFDDTDRDGGRGSTHLIEAQPHFKSCPRGGRTARRALAPAGRSFTVANMRKRADLVLLGDRIWYLPDGVYELQCVARTRRGPRCRNVIEYGQITNWTPMRSTHGLITVYDLSGLPDATLQRWREQHCELHDSPDTVDFCSPEWEPFDAVRHAAMVTSLEEKIAEYTRRLHESVTDDWQRWQTVPM